MKAAVRFFANEARNVCADPEIAAIISKDFSSPWLPWGGKKIQQYLRAFAEGPGCWVHLHFNQSLADARRFEYLVLAPKHVIRESHQVAVANMDLAESLPVHHETEFGQFRVRTKLLVDKIKPTDDRIWSMEFCEGFIARQALVREMLTRFAGVAEADVLHYRTKEPLEGWAGFYSKHWLARVIEDSTTFVKQLDHGSRYIDSHGLHAAEPEDLSSMPDLFRLPQVYNQFGDSLHVVRKAVMDFWFDQGVTKSFFVQPLLVRGTDEYDEYLALWEEINTALAVNPRNRIGP
jgi:hypothetical protein